jgi:hypothetical protein
MHGDSRSLTEQPVLLLTCAVAGRLVAATSFASKGSDCCQNCCQDHGQLPTRADKPGISPQQADTVGQFWTICPCLGIRRLGF